jgi:hypothetical protein
MTLQIELLGKDDVVELARTFQQSHVSIGGGDGDDIQVSGLPARALVVVESADGAWVEGGGARTPLVSNEPLVVRFGRHALRACVYRALQAAPGACPRCGGAIDERSTGGAYRSMVKRERACAACGTAVLELDEAADAIGEFAERSETEWLVVTAPMSCPECSEPLTRTMLRTAHGQAEVERCAACALVVLDKNDRAVLAG